MRSKIWGLIFKDLKIVIGVILIIGGIIGLFLPFLQGILMITAGLALLGNKTALKKLRHVKHWLKQRFKR